MPLGKPLFATPESEGAVGDGVKDDSSAINALSLAISQQGGGIISFDPNKRYYITQPVVVFPGVSMQGNGATLQTDRNIYFIMVPNPSFNGQTYESSYTSLSPRNPQKILSMAKITSPPPAGANTISIDHGHGFSIGDTVCVRLGQNPTDPPEARIAMIAKIVEIEDERITLDKEIPTDTDLSDINVQNAMVYKFKHMVEDISIHGFNFETLNGSDVEGGIWLEWCRNIQLQSLTANRFGGINMGAGILTAVRTAHISAKDLRVFHNANSTGQKSKGRLLGIGSSSDCTFEDVSADDCQSWIAVIEGYSQAIRMNGVFYNDVSASTVPKTLFLGLEGSAYFIDGLEIKSNSNIVIDGNGGTLSFGTIKNVTVTTEPGKFPVVGPTASYKGYFRFSDGSRRFELDFDNLHMFEKTISLSPHMDESLSVPGGIVVDLSAYASPDCNGITALFKGTVDNGVDRTFLVSPGHWESEVFHDGFALLGYGPYYNYHDVATPTKILLRTGAIVSGFIKLRCSVAPFIVRK